MKIKQFVPVAIAAIAGLCVLAHKTEVPVAPIGAIATIGSVLLATQLEDRKLGNFLGEVLRIFKTEHHA